MQEDEEDEEDGGKCCPIVSFALLLTSSLAFMCLYAALHIIYIDTILHIFEIDAAFGGVYIILIVDILCSTFAIFMTCCISQFYAVVNVSILTIMKFFLAIVYIILLINCLVNCFVGIFITTGLTREQTPAVENLSVHFASFKKTTSDCADDRKDPDCKDLHFVSECFLFMYIHLFIRAAVLVFARTIFCLKDEEGRRTFGSITLPPFLQGRQSLRVHPAPGAPGAPPVTDWNAPSRFQEQQMAPVQEFN